MGNRKQPFGYRVVMGEITLHPQEAKLVEHQRQCPLGQAAGHARGKDNHTV